MQKIGRFFNIKFLLSLFVLLGLFTLWVYQGVAQTGIHVDLARDLHYLSEIWVGKIVWLGPMTSANFPTPPIYYYLLFPGLLLSSGNGLSIIFSQTFFALLALTLFAYFQSKNSLISTLFVILTIGLSPWWIRASTLPWNGHMYVAWVFLALTSLWFKNPIFISALLFGISIAINPVAILALPVLFYEWLTYEKKIKNLVYVLLGLLLPWTPILIFEIITRGFLIRQWLEQPSAAGIIFSPNMANISPLLNTIGISQVPAVVIWLMAFLIGSKRAKYWLVMASLPLIFLMLFSPLRGYYLLGLICALTFITLISLSSKTIGRILLIIFIFSYIQMISFPPLNLSGRSIPRMNNVVDTFIENNHLDKTKKYAVVSVIDSQNSTPQADDYRFFLRMKGVNALSLDQYNQADILVLFVEVPNFNWQDFEDWHTQQFGSRKLLSSQNIDGIEIIIYGRN
ncbi:hypothetical protein HYS94_03710 [Candidatus Daviesbacteria bacterium]|nr:hypothetical protein [Candidatus Daviesbacteria bacterium]